MMKGRGSASRARSTWRLVWADHESGMATRAIARKWKLAPSTVRYYLSKGNPREIKAGEIAAVLSRRSLPTESLAEVIPLRRAQ